MNYSTVRWKHLSVLAHKKLTEIESNTTSKKNKEKK